MDRRSRKILRLCQPWLSRVPHDTQPHGQRNLARDAAFQ